jgi:anti-anti-sigma factor
MTVATVDASTKDGSVRIRLSGEIDRENAPVVEEEILAVVTGQPMAVSVDLTNLTYIDSVGIRLLFDLVAHLQESHIVLELISPFDSPTRRLIEFSGLDSLVTLHPACN